MSLEKGENGVGDLLIGRDGMIQEKILFFMEEKRFFPEEYHSFLEKDRLSEHQSERYGIYRAYHFFDSVGWVMPVVLYLECRES